MSSRVGSFGQFRYSSVVLARYKLLAEEHFPTLVEICRFVWKAIMRYSDIDGEQRAASFAYYAFFSLFPLILLITVTGSLFFEKNRVQEEVLNLVGAYIPLSTSEQAGIMQAISGFIQQRGKAGILALLGVAWTSLRFFQALVRGVNRAWGTHEYSWWRLPIQNLLMVGIVAAALLVGMFIPAVMKVVEGVLERYSIPYTSTFLETAILLSKQMIPSVVLCLALLMFFKLAPRQHAAFRHVWPPAVLVTVLLQLLQALFVWYARSFANFNAIYGAFGGAIALLMWIYFSGSVIIFGGCLSAVLAEARQKPPVGKQDKTPV